MGIKIYRAYLFSLGIFCALALHAQNTWIKFPQPVLTRSATFPNWEAIATADPFVLKDGDTLKMWYSGSGWLTSSDDCPHVRMGYAWSLDGTTWNEHASNPVLNISSDSSDFDYDGIETPSVIKDFSAPSIQRYKLWYAGRKSRCSSINDHKFGYAYSPDGVNWTKYAGNPVMVGGDTSQWYNTFISNPSVIQENGSYKMWFTAPDLVVNGQPTDGKGNIGYATAPDGITWTVYSAPVLTAGAQGNRDSASIAEPSVLKISSTYYMFYSSLSQWNVENFQEGYATSVDGINWAKSISNPVLKIGGSSAWDRYWASHAGLIYDSTTAQFRMWYTGRDTATISSLTGYFWDIGYAHSDIETGIQVIPESQLSLFLFPNPAADQLTILNVPYYNIREINLINQLGQVQKVKWICDEKQQSIDISDLSNGLYFISLKTSEGLLNSKFLIQR